MKAQNINRLKTFTYSALFVAICIGWTGCDTFESIQELYAIRSLDIDNDFDYEERSFAPEPRIVGGRESVPHSHPYIVAMYSYNGTNWTSCGGSILTNKWVLTAAHCVEDSVEVTVLAGTHNRSSFQEGGQRCHSKNVVINPNYNENTLEHDIALVKINETFVFTKSVQPAVLVKNGNIRGNATVAGWGRLSENASVGSDVLMEVDVMLISRNDCRKAYPEFVVSYTHLCAGHKQGKKSSCKGDSGSPLFQTLNGKETVVGIDSWQTGCARPKQPTVYTRVAKYLEFIQKHTGYGARRGSVSKVHGRILSPWRPWYFNKMQNLQPRNPAPKNSGPWNPGWWSFGQWNPGS